MADTDLVQRVASLTSRRKFLSRVGVATLSAASVVLALPQPAAATVTVKCCNLCINPSDPCPNYVCTWSWTCCYGGRKYRCIEYNRYVSNCTSSCTGVRCSRIRDIGAC
jgi:hypothetical protein